MTTRWRNLLLSLGLGLGLTLVPALLALPARAAGPICTVCSKGTPTCTYATIQEAVDDFDCRQIKVAQGVYTGVRGRRAPAGYWDAPASGLITQVVYISRTVAVQGGYTATNWTASYPLTQVTTLDAGGLGRPLVVAGNISPTIEGLSLTNGDAAGLGGGPSGDGGGGAYVMSATASISDCRVFSNTAYSGGGLYLEDSPAKLSANGVISNTARNGGGLYLSDSLATLSANRVISNTALLNGGGLYLTYMDLEDRGATLISNSVTSNIALKWGGGVWMASGRTTLISNRVTSNTATLGAGLYLSFSNSTLISNSVTANAAGNYGGGLLLDGGTDTLIANRVTSNTAALGGGGLLLQDSLAALIANSVISNAARYGGGLYLWGSGAGLTNTVIADNRASYGSGSGLYVDSSSPWLVHTTIARNGGGEGSGLYVDSTNGPSTTRLTNTILVSHTVGISLGTGSAATLAGTLWYGNGTPWGGAGTLTRTGDITGAPAFADPNAGDYHLTASSAAIDQGVPAGVTTDKDGRPRVGQPDLGAYEFALPAWLPSILKNGR